MSKKYQTLLYELEFEIFNARKSNATPIIPAIPIAPKNSSKYKTLSYYD